MLDVAASTLLLVDVQQRLLPAIADGAAVIERCAVLARAARLLDVPVVATEQYPRGLGATVPELAGFAGTTLAKLAFDAAAEPALAATLDPARRTIVVAGCEAHVCVLQTAIGLHQRGWHVAVAADAVGSRRPSDRETGLARMARAGVEIITVEMAVFEWLGRGDHPRFREVHRLIR